MPNDTPPPHSHEPLKVGSPRPEPDAVPAGLWLAGEFPPPPPLTPGRANSPTQPPKAPLHCVHEGHGSPTPPTRPPVPPIMTRSSNSSTSSRNSPTTPPYMPTPPPASLPLPDHTSAYYAPYARGETTPLLAGGVAGGHSRKDSRHAHRGQPQVHWGGDVEARAALASAREFEIVLRMRERAVGRATVRFWRTLFIALAVAAMLAIVVASVAVTNAPPPPNGPAPYPLPGPDRPA
ncbi:hypothetical protein Q8F55_007586 [Vanrija albida]|uniref:Uncharacterized protein n=1 Tax=Vanrija albida TaxID=181172 RepID=A0ABR3PTY9_9TREE